MSCNFKSNKGYAVDLEVRIINDLHTAAEGLSPGYSNNNPQTVMCDISNLGFSNLGSSLMKSTKVYDQYLLG